MSLLLVVMTNNNGIKGTHFQILYMGFSASKLRDSRFACMTDTWHMTVHEMMRTRSKKHEKQPRVHVAAYSIQGRIFSQSRLLPDASRQNWISFGRNKLNLKNNCFVIITLDQYRKVPPERPTISSFRGRIVEVVCCL